MNQLFVNSFSQYVFSTSQNMSTFHLVDLAASKPPNKRAAISKMFGEDKGLVTVRKVLSVLNNRKYNRHSINHRESNFTGLVKGINSNSPFHKFEG